MPCTRAPRAPSGSVVVASGTGPTPVSYTHLDVYKRQAQPTVRASQLGFWQTGIAVFVFWNLFTLLGAWLGNALGDPRRWGLDAAAAAAFVALLWPRLHSRDAAATAVVAVVLTVAVAPWAPAGIPVLIAAFAAVALSLIHI